MQHSFFCRFILMQSRASLMTKLWLFSATALLLFSSSAGVWAQQLPIDGSTIKTDSVSIPVANTIALYMNRMGEGLSLYNGKEYLMPDPRIEGHPFFESDSWQQGSLVYGGKTYVQIPFIYDIVSEEVVLLHNRSDFTIKLRKDQLDRFSLFDHHFIKLDSAHMDKAKMPVGYYDLRYNGISKVLVKRRKILFETAQNSLAVQRFVQKDLYYIEKNGHYFPVKTKASVLKVLSDQKKQLRKFLKRNNIAYKKDPEAALVKMLAFYDQATHQE